MTSVNPHSHDQPSLPPHLRYVPKVFCGSSHWWALAKISNLDPATRVLDIGPGSGVVGRELRARGFSNLFAVEIDESTRAALGSVYSRIESNLKPFQNLTFGSILLLDVLEHMNDPFSFFSEVAGLLEPGGVMLISVPNIAHWSVRIPLFFGRFKYQERGILDKTHLQHFTRARAKELVAALPNITLAECGASIEPVELILPSWLWNNALFRALSLSRQSCARILPGLLAYQHLLMVRRDG